MATYKVLQDIEAEDKFVGPLTLKQFIMAGVAAVTAYISFFLLTKGLWILLFPLAPVFIFTGFMAFPWGRDQPTEVWLLAKIRFMMVPRRRIWDQTGMAELVTITAPKNIEHYTGDNLSQIEVKSRLKALADTIDSRGWAVKNASVNLYSPPTFTRELKSTDRLVEASVLTTSIPQVSVSDADDIMDEQNNPTAQHLNKLVNASSQAHRQATLENLTEVREHKPHQKSDHKAQPPSKVTGQPPVTGSHTKQNPDSNLTPEEKALLTKIHSKSGSGPMPYGNTKVIEPLPGKKKHTAKHPKVSSAPAHNRGKQTSLKGADPAILGYANNDDLTVATIARQVNKKPGGEPYDGEIVVPLR